MAGNIAIPVLSMFEIGAIFQSSTNGLNHVGSLQVARYAAYLSDSANLPKYRWPEEETDTTNATIYERRHRLGLPVGK